MAVSSARRQLQKRTATVHTVTRKSHQSGSVNKDAPSAEGDVVASVEAVPECTEEEDGDGAAYSVVDDKAQPVRGRAVPVVKQLLQTGAQLPTATTHCRQLKSLQRTALCTSNQLTLGANPNVYSVIMAQPLSGDARVFAARGKRLCSRPL